MLKYLPVLFIVIFLLKESYGQDGGKSAAMNQLSQKDITPDRLPGTDEDMAGKRLQSRTETLLQDTGKTLLQDTGKTPIQDTRKTLLQDTTRKQLPEVIIRAFEQNRPLKEVAAPVSIVGTRELSRYGNTSLLPAVNALPGIRMEERSPGSYRLNIRGSSLRSPFGIRNVKIYLDGIPFTDPGGNTYLNQLSFFDVSGMEIIKGPGSSLYGAGTGGVMLLSTLPAFFDPEYLPEHLFSASPGNNTASPGNNTASPGNDDIASPENNTSEKELQANLGYGSYNAYTANLNASFVNKDMQNKFSYTHQQSNGYRDHSYLRRDIGSWHTMIRSSEKRSLSAYMLYGDMYYETPGGLTRAQYQQDPRAAKTAAGSFPGAADNKAAIYQKTYWLGLQQQYRITGRWENHTAVYGAFSRITNPAILNYEKRMEPHFGGRTSFSFHTSLPGADLNLVAGAEFQQGFSSIKVYANEQGDPGALQTDDEVNSRTGSLFLQAELSLAKGWIATAGISATKSILQFTRLSETPAFRYNARFYNEWAPRISLLKKLTGRLSVYGVVSKGFSPPTVAEVLPSTSVINTGLKAEQGINYEAGFRGSFFRNRLNADISAYYFGLKKAITQRRDQSGADYFVNAGSTRQQGIESSLAYRFLLPEGKFLTGCTIWLNHTFTHYRYRNFQKDADDFSGNRIPGVAPHSLTGGVDLDTRPGLYANLTWFYSDAIALNDANTDLAGAYRLLGFRTGYKIPRGRRLAIDLFISGDNLLNEQYSLGYDINAAGGRFYNAAPGINFQLGVKLTYFPNFSRLPG